MTMLKSEVRQEIIDQGCEKCGEPVSGEPVFTLTFYRGGFIVLHEECIDFILYAQKGQRQAAIT